ncbi:hypothetical protein PMIN01_04824 [Paraphaeosphaeria minitans]|uniref:Xylanolytic transcriptional activator regulatory domain-containing protein n=1 Tax=Paraphaeosphaeria minitans TaxID=565426 RepID=A0A9P6GME1_9PLEO|nr:hypothetical protein PMIN01_04824 [Paraphaeosphaeria minitans]
MDVNIGLPQNIDDFIVSSSQTINGADVGSFFLDSTLSNTSLSFPTPAIEAIGPQVLTPDVSDGVSPWASGAASALCDEDHPLDHSIDLVDGLHQKNRVWPEELYKDFSSFAVVRFIGRSAGDLHASGRDEDLQHSICNKVRGPTRVDDPHKGQTKVPLPSYAQPEILQFIDLFFQEHYSYPIFVSRQLVVEVLMEAMRSATQTDPSALILLNSVLAIGCREALRKHRMNSEKTSPVPHMRPLQYFQCALERRAELSNGPPTVLKLQALVSMIVFVHRGHDAALTKSLLSLAISMISDLSLTTPTAGGITTVNPEEIERMFWLLYSIEKPHALRFGSHSVVDDDLLVYHAPSKKRSGLFTQGVSDYSGWEIVKYRYARLCSVIVKTLYSHLSLRMTAAEVSAAIEKLTGMLESWRLSIPAAYRPDRDRDGPECHEHAGDAIIRSDISLKYAEVSLAIHRWVLATSDCPPELVKARISSKYQCAAIAKRVLGAAHSCRTDSGSDWPVVMLPALSAVVLYILMKRGDEGEDCLPYLGIASGFFGKLCVKAETDANLFAEVSELFLAAHPKTLGQYQTPPESMRGSIEDDPLRLQMGHRGVCETTTGELGCFDFPQDIAESIFNITTLDDMIIPT